MTVSLPTRVQLPQSIDAQLAESALRLIQQAQRIVIIGHMHPDGDALGSTLGFGHALAAIGKSITVAVPDTPDEVFAAFLPGFASVVTELTGPAFDLIIALDAGDRSRYGDMFTRFADQLNDVPILNMDHHITSAGFGLVNIIDVRSAAAAELVTLLLNQVEIPVTHEAAKCLLAGIITDTRAFEYDATTARTLQVGAYLMERGAVPVDVVKPMFRMKSFASAKLFGQSIATISSDLDGRLVWSEVTPAMWEQAQLPIGIGDDGIPSYLIDIDGSEIAIVFRQHADDLIRISVRTASHYDATRITTQFGGGGHPRAAGCTVHADLATAQSQILAAARTLLHDSV